MNPRLRALLAAAGVLAFALAAWEMRDRAAALEAAAASARSEAARVGALAAQHKALAASIADLEARMGTAEGAQPIVAYLDGIARIVGLGDGLRSVSARAAVGAAAAEGEAATEETAEAEIGGAALGALVSFLEAVENGRADVVVRSIYLRPNPRAPDLLDATVVVASVRP